MKKDIASLILKNLMEISQQMRSIEEIGKKINFDTTTDRVYIILAAQKKILTKILKEAGYGVKEEFGKNI
ncbi:hypothetical protein N9W84_01370 [bacterium]|nr:hypothetical protein [bacterium]